MTKQKITLTDDPADKAPDATARVSPCRIDGPFAEGRTFGGKVTGGKGVGGKVTGGKGAGGKVIGGKSFGAKA